jgi:redox-sensitive bicupin YhaK (pirin superfamily)
LRRVFGYYEAEFMDPFLLLDFFGSDDPKDYLAGFPWHPHRGIETITYMLDGRVRHGDSIGNKGTIGPGDVQWMTAGSGIIHEEMPEGNPDGRMKGFQLWANLPASNKMMEPRYRDVTQEIIPVVQPSQGISIRVIAGSVNGMRGPVQDVVTQPQYLDVQMEADREFTHSIAPGHTSFAFAFEGSGIFDASQGIGTSGETLIMFSEGDEVRVETDDKAVRFLLVSGKPIHEPIAWRGPIVMNTQEELQIAFAEYRNGTFLKHKPVDS